MLESVVDLRPAAQPAPFVRLAVAVAHGHHHRALETAGLDEQIHIHAGAQVQVAVNRGRQTRALEGHGRDALRLEHRHHAQRVQLDGDRRATVGLTRRVHPGREGPAHHLRGSSRASEGQHALGGQHCGQTLGIDATEQRAKLRRSGATPGEGATQSQGGALLQLAAPQATWLTHA